MEESESIKKLFIDEKEMARRVQASLNKASQIFKIDKTSGKIIFENFAALGDLQRISTLLCGKHLAKEYGVKTVDRLGVTEIARELHRPKTTLSRPLAELRRRGWIDQDLHKKYFVVPYYIDKILEDALRVMAKRSRRVTPSQNSSKR